MARSSFLDRHHFLLRRLHSLSGVVPIGVFLLFHLITNASIIWGSVDAGKFDEGIHTGAAVYQHEVNFIHSLPALVLIEVFIIWLPIAFHAVLGAVYAAASRPNTRHYGYWANVRYMLQRVTSWIGLLFVVYHVGTLKWGFTRLIPGRNPWEAEYAASTMASALQGSTDGMTLLGWAVVIFYFVGVSSLVYHLANGLWTAAITWGLTISEGAQRRWGYVCAAFGAVLMAAGWTGVIGFATLDYHEARQAEISVHRGYEPEAEEGIVELNAPPKGGQPGVVTGANHEAESQDERDG